jgi:Cupin
MGVVISLEKPDALTDLLDMLKPRGRVFCCSEMSAPWAMSLPVDGYARFHLIERGNAWLKVEGAKQVTALASGDLVIVPHGNGHILADSPNTKPVPIIRLVKGNADSAILLQHGGGGAQTLMTCGSFQIVNGEFNPLLAVLPPLIVPTKTKLARQ